MKRFTHSGGSRFALRWRKTHGEAGEAISDPVERRYGMTFDALIARIGPVVYRREAAVGGNQNVPNEILRQRIVDGRSRDHHRHELIKRAQSSQHFRFELGHRLGSLLVRAWKLLRSKAPAQ